MIKKVFVFVISAIIILSLFVFNNTPVFINYADNYEAYLTDFSCSNKIIKVNKYTYPFTLNIKGESAVLKKETFNLQSFLEDLNAEIIAMENGEKYTCYYAYSPDIKKTRVINGQTINLHIAITDKQVKVGCPIIYGSF